MYTLCVCLCVRRIREIFVAGMVSGVFTTAILAPGDRIKCLLQVQQSPRASGAAHTVGTRYTGPVDVVRQLYREGGLWSIFKGTGATLARDVPGTGPSFLWCTTGHLLTT